MRRSPEEKRRDPERTRARIVQAAVEEFAEKGYARARTSEIAERAGVNKQLISYYFGGKEGLYREINRRWQTMERAFADPSQPYGQLLAAYIRANAANPDFGKLLVWQGLTGGEPPDQTWVDEMRQSVEDVRRRQDAGELPPDLDPGALFLAFFAVAGAGFAFPQIVRVVFDLDPASPEFADRYAGQVERLVQLLSR